MNYNYLRYFSVLAQTEHYTLAAARLSISQPSLSSAIHQLETELGDVKLFEKVGRNIRLTEEGRYYREKVDIALEDERNKFLRNKAWAWAGYLFVILSAVGSLILRFAGQEELANMAAGAMGLLVFLYWASYMVLSRKY